jgi:hypothetical protein
VHYNCNYCSDVAVVLPKKGESAPHGYSTVHSTYLKHEADLNTGTGGTAIFLAYKQQLVRAYTALQTKLYRNDCLVCVQKTLSSPPFECIAMQLHA